ncbi:MAG: nucleoside recognition domain-containing protein, partial [Bacteroidota bacterium]
LVKLIFFQDVVIFSRMMDSTFDMAKTGFEISLGLTGILTLWLGLMKVGEKGGVIRIFSKVMGPLFNRLLPDIPKNHPVIGSMMMNVTANMMGLDNAATPLGLKAMQQLQELNPKKDTASNAQIMFLVLNTAGIALLPISIMVFRKTMGAENPSDVLIPIILSTFSAAMGGMIVVAIYQRINLLQPVILAYVGGLGLMIFGIVYYFTSIPKEQVAVVSGLVSNILLFTIIITFIGLAVRKRVNIYDTFIEGAVEGFKIAVKIIPYLVSILVAIGVFRASGAMDAVIGGIAFVLESINVNTDFVAALPTALMKPLSGSGARGLMVETMATYGADSFVGRIACIVQGSTDTTFYIIAVYFGSVNIKNIRYAIGAGLIADLIGITAAILIGYMFFH